MSCLSVRVWLVADALLYMQGSSVASVWRRCCGVWNIEPLSKHATNMRINARAAVFAADRREDEVSLCGALT